MKSTGKLNRASNLPYLSVDSTRESTLFSHIKQLWYFRELIQNLIMRDIKAQTKQSLLGYAWIFLPPLFQMGIFTLLFRGILGVQMTEKVPYAVFLYCTILPWNMFANMVSQGTLAIVSHGTLIKQVYFPKESVIISTIAAEAFKTLIASIALVALLMIYNVHVGVNLLWLPLLIFLQIFFTLGITLPLAMFNAFARDISKGITIIMSIWMYLTPVVYPIDKVPLEYLDIYKLNPMARLIQGYRQVILDNVPPEMNDIAILFAVSFITFLCGYKIFKKAEAMLADII
jgi:ABC-2 type transport system permease protein